MNELLLRRARLFAAALLLGLPLLAWAAPSGLEEIEQQLRGKPNEAIVALDAFLSKASEVDRIEALVLRGQMQSRLGDAAAVERGALELESMAAAQRQPLAQASAALLRARWLMRSGPLSRADRLMTDALAQVPAGTPPRLRQRFLSTHARIKLSLGKLDDSVRLYLEATRLADQLGVDWRRAEQRTALAYALYRANQLERAFEVNQEAIALAEGADDKVALSDAMNVQGMVYGTQGRTVEELKVMKASIDYARLAGARHAEVLGLANLSDFYLVQGDYARALSMAQDALPLARAIKDPASESVALINAGLALIGLGRYEEGMVKVRETLMLLERGGDLTQMASVQLEIGQALEKAGHIKVAWAALKHHRALSDQVFQRDQQQAMLEMQEGFDAERRQRELALLQNEKGLKEAELTGRDLQQRLWVLGITAGVLVLALVGVLLRRMRHSNAALSTSNDQLKVASERDPLTGLANRRHFQAEMQRTAVNGHLDGSLLLIDIDHFKRINDAYGHAAGDAVLVEIARRLSAALRTEDLTVRWGGEEFLIVSRARAAEEVEALAERLLAAIGGEAVEHDGGHIAVTASIGFATFPLAPALRPLNWERAIDLVDTAMYLAKAHGRNRAYGIRSFDAEAAPGDGQGSNTAGDLESAWRSGRADLRHLAGPQSLAVTP